MYLIDGPVNYSRMQIWLNPVTRPKPAGISTVASTVSKRAGCLIMYRTIRDTLLRHVSGSRNELFMAKSYSSISVSRLAHYGAEDQSFFAALERLDEPDDTQNEGDSLEGLLARSPRPHKSPGQIGTTTPSVTAEPASLRRVNTEPQNPSTEGDLRITGLSYNEHPRRANASADPKVRTVRRAQTTGTMPGTRSGVGPAVKKRRIENIKTVPPEQQIFRGLVFCKVFSAWLACLLC